MTDKLTSLDYDASSKQLTIRDLTEEEIADRNEIQQKVDLAKAEQEAKEAARNSALSKLAALGLTEEEIAAL